MNLRIVARHASLPPATKALIDRRLHYALDRLADRIGRVEIRLRDVNGPRGGRDQQCRLEASLVPSGQIMVEETAVNMESAVSLAADRLADRIKRELNRRESRRRRAVGHRRAAVGGD